MMHQHVGRTLNIAVLAQRRDVINRQQKLIRSSELSDEQWSDPEEVTVVRLIQVTEMSKGSP
jgi:hypothetical protein